MMMACGQSSGPGVGTAAPVFGFDAGLGGGELGSGGLGDTPNRATEDAAAAQADATGEEQDGASGTTDGLNETPDASSAGPDSAGPDSAQGDAAELADTTAVDTVADTAPVQDTAGQELPEKTLPDVQAPPKIDAQVLKPGECINTSDCPVGVCVAGKCCGDAGKVCGAVCCGGAEVCYAGACVLPGKGCVAQEDCAPDGYCETALGDKSQNGGKKVVGSGPQCIAPAPELADCGEIQDLSHYDHLEIGR